MSATRHTRGLGPFVVMLMAASAGCGSEPADTPGAANETTPDAAFVKRAEVVCAQYVTYNRAHDFRMAGFNRFDPDEELLPKVADVIDRNPSFHTLVPGLRALGEPKTGADAWDVVLADLEKGAKLTLQQVASAREADAAAFVRYENQITTNSTALHLDLQKSGLPGDHSCREAQIDPLLTRAGH